MAPQVSERLGASAGVASMTVVLERPYTASLVILIHYLVITMV